MKMKKNKLLKKYVIVELVNMDRQKNWKIKLNL